MEKSPDIQSPPRISVKNWNPLPLQKPSIDPDVLEMDGVLRSTEIIRYSILRAEYWISPSGSIREWLRFNLMMLCIIGIPSLLIVPVITYLLNEFATWTLLLAQIATNLAIPGGILLAIVLVSAAIFALRRAVKK